MHLEDDGDDDAPVFGAPLPPEDRLWRHPSELARHSDAPVAPRAPATATGSRLLGIAVVSSLVGAVLTVGVVAVTVGLGDTERPAVERVASGTQTSTLVSLSAAGGAAAVAERLQSSVARVAVGSPPVFGSAVVLRADGFLLTDAVLLAGATTATVTLGGDDLPATVVGTDPLTDVAVLHVDRTDLSPAAAADGHGAAVGDRAYVVAARAAGAPAVSAGIVNALGRKVTAGDGTVLHGMLQHDAPVDATAIGGALADDRAVVIGVVTGPASSTGGYAVPIATARATAADIISTGHARHVWLGVEGTDLDEGGATLLHVAGGANVTKVAQDSPASAAGLKDGDVITGVGGEPVTSMSDLVVGLRSHDPGETVDVEYWRDGERQHCSATLAERAA